MSWDRSLWLFLKTWLKWSLRFSIRSIKWVTRTMLRTSIETMAACVLVLSIVAGILMLIEPARLLRLRRSVRFWKVIPLVLRLKPVQILADALYRMTNMPAIAVVIGSAQLVMRLMFAPMIAFLTVLSDPATARSVIFLVGLPTLLLGLGCSKIRWMRWVRSLNRVAGLVPFLTWIITTLVIIVARAKSPKVLMWAISDVSIPIYLTLLAVVLSVVTVIEILETATEDRGVAAPGSGKSRLLCLEYVSLSSLSILAAVAALWILKMSDSRFAALCVLQDVRRMSTG